MAYNGNPDFWTSTVPEYLGGLPSNSDIIPKHPESTTDFSRVSEEDKPAVDEMEATLNTDDPIYQPQLEENEFMSNYVGTYDVTGVGGESVLLSPQRVNSDRAIALHYVPVDGEEGEPVTYEWQNVENVTVVDGYVYGTLDSFSPVAVFEVKTDIYLIDEAPTNKNYKALICNGNRTILWADSSTGKYYAKNEASGTVLEVPWVLFIIGGSLDGTALNKTDIVIKDSYVPNWFIMAGSCSPEIQTSLKSANITVDNSTVGSVTGSTLKVRTEELNINIVNNSFVRSYLGAGESQNAAVKNCVNNEVVAEKGLRGLDLTAPYSLKTANINVKDSKIPFLYAGGNCGNSYTETSNVKIDGLKGTSNWICACSSNGKMTNVNFDISNAENIEVFETTNRGVIENVNVTIKKSNIPGLYVTGEEASDVNGTVDKVAIDIDATVTGELKAGYNGGVLLTAEEAANVVKHVKYSRNADLIISDDVVKILGSKLIKK